MAEKTSGDIYRLRASTLAGYGTLSRTMQRQFNDPNRITLSDIGESIGDEIRTFGQFKEADDEIDDLLTQVEDTSYTDFEGDIGSISDRGGAVLTTEQHGQIRGILTDLKSDNYDAYYNGDKGDIEAVEGTMTKMQQGILGWLEVGEALPSIQQNAGFTAGMTAQEQHVIGEVASGRSELKMDADNNLVMAVTMPDGEVLDLTKAQFDSIVAENVMQTDWIANENDRLLAFGMGEGDFDTEKAYADNKKVLTSKGAPKLSSLLRDKGVVAGTDQSVKEMLKDHPSLKDMKIPVNSETKKYNTDGDDFITINDFEADDYESLCKLLEAKPDLAYGIIAEMMTLQQAKMRNQNKVKEDKKQEQAGVKPQDPTLVSTEQPGAIQGVSAITPRSIYQEAVKKEGAQQSRLNIVDDLREGEREEDIKAGIIGIKDEPTKAEKPLDEALSELGNTIYIGNNIASLKERFKRQAKLVGMSDSDIENIFSGVNPTGVVIKTKDGKYEVRLARATDKKDVLKESRELTQGEK